MTGLAISLNSAFFGFYAHTGFMLALQEMELKPHALAGTSSGALVSAFYAVGYEMQEIAQLMSHIRKEDFWEGHTLQILARNLTAGWQNVSGLLTGRRLRKVLHNFFGDTRMEELQIPLGISVANLSQQRRELWTSGHLVDAVMCSLAFPLLFEIQTLNNNEYIDGGLVDGEPIQEFILQPDITTIITHGVTRQKKRFRSKLRRAVSSGINLITNETNLLKQQLANAYQKELIRVVTQSPYIGPDDLSAGSKIIQLARIQTLKQLENRFKDYQQKESYADYEKEFLE